jgi:hypothetical protein
MRKDDEAERAERFRTLDETILRIVNDHNGCIKLADLKEEINNEEKYPKLMVINRLRHLKGELLSLTYSDLKKYEIDSSSASSPSGNALYVVKEELIPPEMRADVNVDLGTKILDLVKNRGCIREKPLVDKICDKEKRSESTVHLKLKELEDKSLILKVGYEDLWRYGFSDPDGYRGAVYLIIPPAPARDARIGAANTPEHPHHPE